MENTKKTHLTLPYTLLITTLQTIISALPGVLLIEDKVDFTIGTLLLFVYLFLSEFYQLFARTAYKNGKSVSTQAFILKIIVSLLLIVSISTKLTFQYGIILASYEAFQYLTFSTKYNYQDTLLHTLLTAFFKGIVFNLMITITYPFTFQLSDIEPYIFSALMIFFSTIIIQNLYSALEKKGMYFLVGLLSLISIALYLIYLVKIKALATTVFYLLVAIILLGTLIVLISKKRKKREFIMTIVLLISITVFYLN